MPFNIWHFLPIFLYAETHYRFRYFFSYLRKNEPEIIADAPHRLDPDTPLPVLVLVKDADQFPVILSGITVVIRLGGSIVHEQKFLDTSIKISDKLWWRIFNIPLNGLTGHIECDVIFEVSNSSKNRFYHNDNHRTSTRQPLKVFVSPSPLPKFEHLHLGECHSHSSYTDDQVEFGAPLEASAQLCHSMGLTFFCATDHSYDLDDTIGNYLKNDLQLPKWQLLQDEVKEFNSKSKNFAIVRGEEVTCRNAANHNIHLLILGNRKFIPGSGDGAEHWFKTRSEHSINDVLNELELSAVAFAAHPQEPISLIQRLLLCRGKWAKKDFAHLKLSGIQFLNGQVTDGFWEGYREWIEALLKNKKMFALAGNDAHGNFNRFRQIGIPFFKIREMDHQLFGKMRTGVFLDSLSEENILQAIRFGKTIVTDGPVVNLLVDYPEHQITSIGQNFIGKNHTVSVEVRSSTEYGSINSLKIFMGIIGEKEVTMISEKSSHSFNTERKFIVEIEKNSYIRAEAWTSSADSKDGKTHFCLTNPVWFTQY